jgi:hypothetical protein
MPILCAVHTFWSATPVGWIYTTPVASQVSGKVIRSASLSDKLSQRASVKALILHDTTSSFFPCQKKRQSLTDEAILHDSLHGSPRRCPLSNQKSMPTHKQAQHKECRGHVAGMVDCTWQLASHAPTWILSRTQTGTPSVMNVVLCHHHKQSQVDAPMPSFKGPHCYAKEAALAAPFRPRDKVRTACNINTLFNPWAMLTRPPLQCRPNQSLINLRG